MARRATLVRLIRLGRLALFGATAALAVATDGAASAQGSICPVWEVEYALTGELRVTETPYGLANGAHKVGPGKMVLRFEPGGHVSLLSYSMQQAFGVEISAFFSTMTIRAETTTRATPDACGVAAEGNVKDTNVVWSTLVRGVHTDGTLTCDGSRCGSMGAPAPGTGTVKVGPNDVRVRPFEFTRDWKTFTMPFTFAVKTDTPKQTSFLALTGHEAQRTCVALPQPCKRQ
jgi:hypothetical protein